MPGSIWDPRLLIETQTANPHSKPTGTPTGRVWKGSFGLSAIQHHLGLGAPGGRLITISSYRSSSPSLPKGLQGAPTERLGSASRTKFPTGHREFPNGYPRGAPNPAPPLLSEALVMGITHCAHLAAHLETALPSTLSQRLSSPSLFWKKLPLCCKNYLPCSPFFVFSFPLL